MTFLPQWSENLDCLKQRSSLEVKFYFLSTNLKSLMVEEGGKRIGLRATSSPILLVTQFFFLIVPVPRETHYKARLKEVINSRRLILVLMHQRLSVSLLECENNAVNCKLEAGRNDAPVFSYTTNNIHNFKMLSLCKKTYLNQEKAGKRSTI